MQLIVILKIILHYFCKNNCYPKFIPKIKCTILLEQLYYMYYNTRPKSVPKGIAIVCFHPTTTCPKTTLCCIFFQINQMLCT